MQKVVPIKGQKTESANQPENYQDQRAQRRSRQCTKRPRQAEAKQPAPTEGEAEAEISIQETGYRRGNCKQVS